MAPAGTEGQAIRPWRPLVLLHAEGPAVWSRRPLVHGGRWFDRDVLWYGGAAGAFVTSSGTEGSGVVVAASSGTEGPAVWSRRPLVTRGRWFDRGVLWYRGAFGLVAPSSCTEGSGVVVVASSCPEGPLVWSRRPLVQRGRRCGRGVLLHTKRQGV